MHRYKNSFFGIQHHRRGRYVVCVRQNSNNTISFRVFSTSEISSTVWFSTSSSLPCNILISSFLLLTIPIRVLSTIMRFVQFVCSFLSWKDLISSIPKIYNFLNGQNFVIFGVYQSAKARTLCVYSVFAASMPPKICANTSILKLAVFTCRNLSSTSWAVRYLRTSTF